MTPPIGGGEVGKRNLAISFQIKQDPFFDVSFLTQKTISWNPLLRDSSVLGIQGDSIPFER